MTLCPPAGRLLLCDDEKIGPCGRMDNLAYRHFIYAHPAGMSLRSARHNTRTGSERVVGSASGDRCRRQRPPPRTRRAGRARSCAPIHPLKNLDPTPDRSRGLGQPFSVGVADSLLGEPPRDRAGDGDELMGRAEVGMLGAPVARPRPCSAVRAFRFEPRVEFRARTPAPCPFFAPTLRRLSGQALAAAAIAISASK